MGVGAYDGKGDLGFQENSDKSIMSCSTSGMNSAPVPNKVSGLAMTSIPMFKSSSRTDPFFETHWDPLGATNYNENFGVCSSVVSHSGYVNPPYNHGMISSHFIQYPSSDSSLADLPQIQLFGSGNFSNVASLYGVPTSGAAAASSGGCPNYLPNFEVGTHRSNADGARSEDDCHVSEERHIVALLNGKRRRRSVESASALNQIMMTDGEQQKDMSKGSFDQPSEQGDLKQNQSTSLPNKQSGKQVKGSSQTEVDTNDTYIHMRARRGQATNSHSLAERVRREKISERMKLLQELVPGCSKITGKAVMLDEIINYVQSLQQQVEFLSMKLATVNPELNIHVERMLSKEVIHTHSDNHMMVCINPGTRNSHPYPHSILQGGLQEMPNSAAQCQHMPQNAWNNEFQTKPSSNGF